MHNKNAAANHMHQAGPILSAPCMCTCCANRHFLLNFVAMMAAAVVNLQGNMLLHAPLSGPINQQLCRRHAVKLAVEEGIDRRNSRRCGGHVCLKAIQAALASTDSRAQTVLKRNLAQSRLHNGIHPEIGIKVDAKRLCKRNSARYKQVRASEDQHAGLDFGKTRLDRQSCLCTPIARTADRHRYW